MKKGEVEKILYNEFKNKLQLIGFNKKRHVYIYENEFLYYRFGFGVVDGDNSFFSRFSCGIGFKIVRRI